MHRNKSDFSKFRNIRSMTEPAIRLINPDFRDNKYQFCK